MLEQAIEHHQAGRLDEAEAMYRHLLATEPNHPEALRLLGVIAHHRGQNESAADLLRRAIALRGGSAAYHNDLGDVLAALHRPHEARTAYEEACRLDPAYAEARNNLGIVLQSLGRQDEAIAAFAQASELEPDFTVAAFNLAGALHEAGRLAEAIAVYRRVLEIEPDDADAWNNLGVALNDEGALADAVSAFERAVALTPSFAGAWRNLGHILVVQGRSDEALVALERALALRPDDVDSACVLGRLLRGQGRAGESVRVLGRTRRAAPENPTVRDALVSALQAFRPAHHDLEVEEDLKRLLQAGVYPPWLALPSARQLSLKYALVERLRRGDSLREAILTGLARDELLLGVMRSAVNTDPVLEQALTRLRRELLLAYDEGKSVAPAWRTLVAALALQCLANEHVFALEDEERRRLGPLRGRCEALGQGDAAPSPVLENTLALLALYEPIDTLVCAPHLAELGRQAWSVEFRELITRTLQEPLQERLLEAEIPSLTSSADPGSEIVRAHYEAHPYPRWLVLPQTETTSLGSYLHRRFPHFTPPAVLEQPLRILVVGCGTGFEPLLLARMYPEAEILALDLSRRSLAYGVRMGRVLGLHNVRFIHADLLSLDGLEERFAMIEAMGVLHHLREPERGWRVLRDRLLPGGVMRIGLYSARARSIVTMAREHIRALGLSVTADGVRDFRARVLAGGDDHEFAGLTESEDFYTLNRCWDLLFHPLEHHFTPVRIGGALTRLDLEFLGFEIPSSEVGECYRARFPEDPRMVDLSAWERFEAQYPHTFVAMYTFWCQKRAEA